MKELHKSRNKLFKCEVIACGDFLFSQEEKRSEKEKNLIFRLERSSQSANQKEKNAIRRKNLREKNGKCQFYIDMELYVGSVVV